MGNWEKVFNGKPTLRRNATVVKLRLTQPVTLKRRGLLLTIFLFEVVNCLLSGDDCMRLFCRHLCVCVCVCPELRSQLSNKTANRAKSNCCLAESNSATPSVVRLLGEVTHKDAGGQILPNKLKQFKIILFLC